MSTSFFGTDGIRTKFGKSPLTPYELMQLGFAIGHWIIEKKQKKTILLGHDTRISCDILKSALKTGLLHHNITIYDASVIPTPALYYAVKTNPRYDIGIMITASHNEYEDNGIKIITKEDGKLTAQDEEMLMNLYHSVSLSKNYNSLGSIVNDNDALSYYINSIIKKFSSHFMEGVTIALDCAQGAMVVCAEKIFKSLGAHVIMLHNEPNGKNINLNNGSVHPEALKNAVIKNMAHIGFAFDGDGDRVITVSHQAIVKDGDDITAILLNHPAYKNESICIGTIMTNQGLEVHLNNLKKTLFRTAVGDRNVINAMEQYNALIGSEPSGHVILGDFSKTADGIFTALRIVESVILTGNWNLESFKKFSQYSINIPINIKKDLSKEPFATIIKKNKEKLINGRVVVRYSGTESVLRIMTEGPDNDQTKTINTLLSEELSNLLTQESL